MYGLVQVQVRGGSDTSFALVDIDLLNKLVIQSPSDTKGPIAIARCMV